MKPSIIELKQRIYKQIEVKREEIIKLCGDIIRLRTENPPGHTTELAQFLRQYLEERGLKVESYEPMRGKPNLVAITEGINMKPNLVLNAHMDEFPAGDEGWEFPPFCGEVRDGKILGRGGVDMKGGLTASLVTFILINEMGIKLPGRLTLTLVSDEETGGKWGTGWLLNNVSAVRGDACLNGEPTGLKVVYGEKGLSWFKLKVPGKAAHTTTIGENAILRMMQIIPILLSLKELTGKIPNELKHLIEEQELYYEKVHGKEAAESLNHVKVNIGVIGGGGPTPNIVPAFCELDFDTRRPIGIGADELKQIIETKIQKIGLKGVSCEFTNVTEVNYTSPSERIVTAVSEVAEEVTGAKSMLHIVPWASDANHFRRAGVPTVLYGPNLFNMAGANEYLLVEDLIAVTKVHAGTVLSYYS